MSPQYGELGPLAALNRRRHLYSAGRPSRWALAHISSYTGNTRENVSRATWRVAIVNHNITYHHRRYGSQQEIVYRQQSDRASAATAKPKRSIRQITFRKVYN